MIYKMHNEIHAYIPPILKHITINERTQSVSDLSLL